uniref:Uncharacterized protein n=1 Tax=Rhizophora mucronata TaxID=61149 RepID=A0A2P2PDM3_RHIMU
MSFMAIVMLSMFCDRFHVNPRRSNSLLLYPFLFIIMRQ